MLRTGSILKQMLTVPRRDGERKSMNDLILSILKIKSIYSFIWFLFFDFIYIWVVQICVRLGAPFRYPRNKSRHVFIMIRVSDYIRRPAWLAAIRFYTLRTYDFYARNVLRSTRWIKLYEQKNSSVSSFEIQIIGVTSLLSNGLFDWTVTRLINVDSAYMWIFLD